ncbi:MAG: aminoacyl-tRNA hydrolase [Candidatus Pacebacteria bacterium]|nr:aminoacyl-tRNA hydrolase [Candidatus Paceibacterota bacterium]
MKLIIGLGNPGNEYKKTRHNVGFLSVDKIISSFNLSPVLMQTKFNAEISIGIIAEKKVILAKPQTFMNLSGQTVREISDYYKIEPKNIIIIQDDLDIPVGKYKISKNRNSGGHKGIQSIIDHLGTKNFQRVRIGIAVENQKSPTEKFVLENFGNEEMEMINEIIEKVVNEISELF